ncbi:hypothetical protein [Fictibacillus gelatini]|uniref:phage adaptor protein n=1 Tax=Fictibacillus gelatini TaxID=225985 RepID=UPI000424CA4C|nr:hypothetical protein [Fictibacillus gelatini]
MNLSQMIDEINKDTDDTFDMSTLLGWINRALDLASDVMRYEKRTTLFLEEGVSDYDLPADLMTLIYVIGSNGPYKELDLLDQNGSGYKRWGNIIGFQNITETVVDMYYLAYLPHLVNPEDVPALPMPFHDLPVLYAVAKAKYQDEEENLYGAAFSEFNNRLRELGQFVARNQKPDRINPTFMI